MAKLTQSFQAETKQLLDLMIHSLYSQKEIFLRELISNAADAIHKLKFEALTQPDLAEYANAPFHIRIDVKPEAKTLTLSDNGIGMSRQEVIQNLGTIAHSGTKAFLQSKNTKEVSDLIGQFGVGFYSAFMVAERVQVLTRKAGELEATLWESVGDGTYTVDDAERAEGPGTTITLHLRSEPEQQHEAEELQDFTQEWTIKSLVKKYSDFIPFPIYMQTFHKEEGKEDITAKDEVLNSQVALWLKSASETTQTELDDFYRQISHDWNNPLRTIQYRAEGNTEFAALMFLPEKKSFDYDYKEPEVQLSLYVKRVFIKAHAKELMPAFLRFVQGVVDTDDLPLNVSREMLQANPIIARMRKALTNKVLGTLKEMMEKDRAVYEAFFAEFGATLKEGIMPGEFHGSAEVDKLKDLLVFPSTQDEKTSLTSLKEYVLRMKPDQKEIYYINGEHLDQIRNSPYLEKLKQKDFEVLLLASRVDAWLVSHLYEYEGKKLQSVSSDNLNLYASEDEKKQHETALQERQKDYEPLLQVFRKTLESKVKEVRFSDRLTDSAVCLVTPGQSNAYVERILQSVGRAAQKATRILELNPDHPILAKMSLLAEDKQSQWAEILYHQAVLNEGSMIEDPLGYSKKITDLLMASY